MIVWSADVVQLLTANATRSAIGRSLLSCWKCSKSNCWYVERKDIALLSISSGLRAYGQIIFLWHEEQSMGLDFCFYSIYVLEKKHSRGTEFDRWKVNHCITIQVHSYNCLRHIEEQMTHSDTESYKPVSEKILFNLYVRNPIKKSHNLTHYSRKERLVFCRLNVLTYFQIT